MYSTKAAFGRLPFARPKTKGLYLRMRKTRQQLQRRQRIRIILVPKLFTERHHNYKRKNGICVSFPCFPHAGDFAFPR